LAKYHDQETSKSYESVWNPFLFA